MRTRISFLTRAALAAGLLAPALTGGASAAVIINVVESGSDVVATGSGTINLAALSSQGSPSTQALIWASSGRILLGAPGSVFADSYGGGGLTGPTNFGAGSLFAPTSGSGNAFGHFYSSSHSILVPLGYTSGSALSGTSTWTGKTFASLGLTPGSYIWSWGSGGTADSMTLNIVSSVPEPGPIALASLAGLAGGLRLAMRRRRAPR